MSVGRSASGAGLKVAFRFEPRQHEGVDRIANPTRILHRRHCRAHRPLECPMIGRLGIAGHRLVGPDGSLIDPGPQDANLVVREAFALGRHDDLFFVHTRDELHQPAFGTLAGLNGRPAFRRPVPLVSGRAADQTLADPRRDRPGNVWPARAGRPRRSRSLEPPAEEAPLRAHPRGLQIATLQRRRPATPRQKIAGLSTAASERTNLPSSATASVGSSLTGPEGGEIQGGSERSLSATKSQTSRTGRECQIRAGIAGGPS